MAFFASKLTSNKFTKEVLVGISAGIGYYLIQLIALTCKKTYVLDGNIPSTPIIIAFWHEEILYQPFLYHKIRKNSKIAVMISDYFAGDVISKLIENFGLDSIRGSTNNNGGRVLLKAIKKMRDGFDVAITPDGPLGPRRSVNEGVVKLAQKTGYPIVCFNYDSSKKWRTKTWDKFLIPRPFSKLSLISSPPLYLNDICEEEACKKVLEALNKNASV